MSQDQAAIDQIASRFFSLFDNRTGKLVDLSGVHDLFIAEAVIIKNVGDQCEIYDLDAFIKPRETLLNGGALKEFCEEEVQQETKIFGGIAQRFSRYRKWGTMDGKSFEAYGWKTIQFVKIQQMWKISSLAWDDET